MESWSKVVVTIAFLAAGVVLALYEKTEIAALSIGAAAGYLVQDPKRLLPK